MEVAAEAPEMRMALRTLALPAAPERMLKRSLRRAMARKPVKERRRRRMALLPQAA